MAKRVCTLGLFTALCIVLGYLEGLVSLSFIAPGVKLGLANSVALLLIRKGDFKGAFAVNIARILLSALLFGSVMSLAFSLSGGIMSLIIMSLMSKIKTVSVVGFSIAGGAIHNVFQAIIGIILLGSAVLYYLPLLILCGGVSGALIGFLSNFLSNKLGERKL